MSNRLNLRKIANKLKKCRKLSGFNQKQIAEMFNIHQGNYSRMENGYIGFDEQAARFIMDEFEQYRVRRINELHHEIKSLEAFKF